MLGLNLSSHDNSCTIILTLAEVRACLKWSHRTPTFWGRWLIQLLWNPLPNFTDLLKQLTDAANTWHFLLIILFSSLNLHIHQLKSFVYRVTIYIFQVKEGVKGRAELLKRLVWPSLTPSSALSEVILNVAVATSALCNHQRQFTLSSLKLY